MTSGAVLITPVSGSIVMNQGTVEPSCISRDNTFVQPVVSVSLVAVSVSELARIELRE